MKTLFVCSGNVFRSQMAKGFYDIYTKDGSKAGSCGTRVEEMGTAGMPIAKLGLPATLEYMRRQGADISAELVTPISKELVDKADRVIVMAEKETWPDYLKNNPKVTYWDIADINVATPEAVAEVGEKVRTRVKELLDTK